jgi:hypothetical protein
MAYASDYYEEGTGRGASVLLLLLMVTIAAAICTYGYMNVLPRYEPPAIRFEMPDTVRPFVPVAESDPEPTEEPAVMEEAPTA